MLSDEAIKYFKENGYSFKEIEGIDQGLMDIENNDIIPFEDVVKRVYKDKNLSHV